MDMDPSLDMDLMSSGMVDSLDLFKDEDALTIIKEMISPDDIDQLPDDLLSSLDCPMDGVQGSIKREDLDSEMQIKQESITPIYLSPERSEMQSPTYKPIITTDPLMGSSFNPVPHMSSASSTPTIIPTAAPLQQKIMQINRQHMPQQQQILSNTMQSMDTTDGINGMGNIIIHARNSSTPN
ncbi:hypothetical protein EVAR_73482_1 [Eumeta japonica]|uniref:Uncharacterized protein n=1 Tax=Eumeta variegata TaxID=151549 RepID=A0A4C1TDX9_EUMVA|nr:hypothetical protein EVAR_73482_1 [Eumeta japonica]